MPSIGREFYVMIEKDEDGYCPSGALMNPGFENDKHRHGVES
jgi:hypothetical protein